MIITNATLASLAPGLQRRLHDGLRLGHPVGSRSP